MPKRVDRNQPEIVEALRKVGASVAITSDLGKGFVDLVVGYQGQNFMLEVKDGQRKPSERKLTDDEAKFHAEWRGQIAKVETVNEALAVIGIAPEGVQ